MKFSPFAGFGLKLALLGLAWTASLRADLVTPPVFTSISVPATAAFNDTVSISATAEVNYSDNSDGNDWNTPYMVRVFRITIDYLPPGGSWTNLNDWMPVWQSPNTASPSLTLNQPGSWYVRLNIMDGRPWYSDTPVYQIVVSPPPSPIITSSLALSVNQGGYVNYVITATSSPTSFSASNLPPGLSLNTSNGLISGYYTGASSVNTTIAAGNVYGTDTQTLSWSLTPASISGSESVSPTPQAVGQAVTLSYTASANFGIAWVEHTVFRPNGSAYVPSQTTGTNGSQSWTPDGGAGTYYYKIRVVDNYYNYQDYISSFAMVDPPVAATTPSPASISFGQSSTVTMTLTQASPGTLTNHWMLWDQGDGHYWTGIGFTWNYASTTGMTSISSLDGTPTGANSSTKSFIYTPNFVGSVQFLSWGANNVSINPNVSTATLTIGKATPSISFGGQSLSGTTMLTGSHLNASASNPYSGSVTAPTGAFTYAIVSASGAGSNAAGAISVGTSLQPGTYTVRATYPGDSRYNANTKDVTFTVSNTAPSASFSLSGERYFGQTITVTMTVNDSDGNYSYSNLWIATPLRGWLTVKADNSIVVSGALSSANSSALAAGTYSRTFTFGAADGVGTFTFALAAVDVVGSRTDAANQTITVNKATPTGSFANRSWTGAHVITAGDLNATFANPYSGSVTAPTGTVTYRFAGTSTAVTAGTSLPYGSSNIEAVYPGDGNYAATTVTAVFSATGVTAPTAFQPTTLGSTFVDLAWGAASSAAGINHYSIYRTPAGGSEVWVADAAGGATTFHDTGVGPTTGYTYRILAVDNGSHSASSVTTTGTTAGSFELFTPIL